MEPYAMYAEALSYPVPGRLEILEGYQPLITGEPHKGYLTFLKAIQRLSLSGWEELYTSTWDLNPLAAPYIGYQTWGENYQRGNFMAKLNAALVEDQIDCDGELPDHLIPVLRYLAVEPEPYPELLEILPGAIERIIRALQKAGPDTPYLGLLESLQAFYKKHS